MVDAPSLAPNGSSESTLARPGPEPGTSRMSIRHAIHSLTSPLSHWFSGPSARTDLVGLTDCIMMSLLVLVSILSADWRFGSLDPVVAPSRNPETIQKINMIKKLHDCGRFP